MAFSTDVRRELARVPCDRQCCALSEINGMVLASGGLSFRGQGRYGLEIRTKHNGIARRYYTMMRRWLNAGSDIRIAKTRQLGEHNRYILSPAAEDIPGMLSALDLLDEKQPFGMRSVPDRAFLRRECCQTAFLRGAFLAGGSLNNPERAYHMEIAVSDEGLAACLCELLNRRGIPAKTALRKSQYIAYVKSAESIADFLTLLGANRARLDFEAIRMNKELRNEINRQMNCDTSNLDKAIFASERQRSMIEAIDKSIGLDALEPALREIAELRLRYPAASLAELGSMTTPSISKSGVSARMRKIQALAEELVNE
ncbi:MAG: DNA-binding protein WhiA [Christensenellales bacterium]|jgi:DNA-binding protein WhiA